MLKTQEKRKEKKPKHMPFTINHLLLTNKGQVILEFTFCMIIILLMIYGVTKVFIWSGANYAERSRAHDSTLISNVPPEEQIDPYFYTPVTMNAIWKW